MFQIRGTILPFCFAFFDREFLVDNVYHSADMPVAQRELMSHLNRRLKRLLATPPYDKFELIGSGLQFKFGQTTVSRQVLLRSLVPF